MNQLISDVKKSLELIKRLQGKVDGLTVVTTASSGGTTSGVLLSDETPMPVAGVGDPGTGLEASRWDHVHEGGTSSGRYRQFVYDNSNPFEFVLDGDGQPTFSLEDLE